MRSVIIFAVITLSLLVGIHGSQQDDFDVDQAMDYRERTFPRMGAGEWLPIDTRSNTQDTLDNPLLRAECQAICDYLRSGSIDESAREAYIQCRKRCLQDRLAGKRKRKSVPTDV